MLYGRVSVSSSPVGLLCLRRFFFHLPEAKHPSGQRGKGIGAGWNECAGSICFQYVPHSCGASGVALSKHHWAALGLRAKGATAAQPHSSPNTEQKKYRRRGGLGEMKESNGYLHGGDIVCVVRAAFTATPTAAHLSSVLAPLLSPLSRSSLISPSPPSSYLHG